MIALNRKKYKPVLHISFLGSVLIWLIRRLFDIRSFFGGKDYDTVLEDHHEDPKWMNWRDHIYFAHKYYYRFPLDQRRLVSSLNNSLSEIRVNESSYDLSISLGGDLMPYRGINATVCKDLWSEVGGFFFGADIVTANLETPIFLKKPRRAVPEIMLANMYFNGDDEIFSVFNGLGNYKGFDLLSIANNHSLDQGLDGLFATMGYLKDCGISYCGASESPNNIDRVPLIERNGIKVGFLGATFSLNDQSLPPGYEWAVNHLPLNKSNPNIEILKQQAHSARLAGADLLIAHLHMGCAYQMQPTAQTITNIRSICESCGLDIVVGNHPHNIQPLEWYKYQDPITGTPRESLICYSLADFVGYDIFKWCHLTLMVKIYIKKVSGKVKLSGIELKPAYTQALVSHGKVKSLMLRDWNLMERNFDSLDARNKKEIQELRPFYEHQMKGLTHLIT